MRKKTNKMTAKLIVGIAVVIAMVLACFSPLANVVATTWGTGDNHISVGINWNGYLHDSVTVEEHTWESSQDVFNSEDNVFVIELFVYKNGDNYPHIQHCGGECGSHYHTTVEVLDNGNSFHYTVTITDPDGTYVDLAIVDGAPITQNGDIDNDNGGNEPHFDGKAYVLWACGTGICYHYFDAIPDFDDGNSTFYKDTEILADNNGSMHFDLNASHIAWALPAKFDRWVEVYKEQNNLTEIDWTEVDPEDIISVTPPDMREWEDAVVEAYQANPETGCRMPGNNASGEEWDIFHNCVDEYYIAAGNLPFIRLQPLNEPQYNNAYVSYGDRNFKVVIHNDDYRGVAMGNLERLHYYPGDWTNPFIKRDQFDISGTDRNNPTPIDSILLESTVMIKALAPNNFEITSIEALDVPEDAVEITYDNESKEYSLVFSSNFYDNVVFEVTDSHNDKYYMQICRYTVDGYFKMTREQKPVIAAEFYFDRIKSYSDFDLVLKINYKDGTSKTVLMEAIDGIDDGLGNITPGYEVDYETVNNQPRGKGLKKSYFEYELTDDEIDTIEDMYINAEFTGSDATTYAGAYVGSGEGVEVKVYRGGK